MCFFRAQLRQFPTLCPVLCPAIRSILSVVLILAGVLYASSAFARVEVVLPPTVAPGQPFVAEVDSDTPLADVFVEWNGKSVPVEMREAAQGWQGIVLLGVPYGLKGDSVSLKVSTVGAVDTVSTVGAVAAGEYKTYARLVPVVAKKYPEQRLTVENKYVELAKKNLDRHNAERARVVKVLDSMKVVREWSMPFLKPVPGDFSSAYGLTRFFNDKPRSPHKGIDLRGAAGTPIHACADGEIVLAEKHFFSGNSIYIDHGQGVVSMYFHMSKMDVPVGQKVHRGDVIGEIGSTGRVTGPHLHFGIAAQGELIDPTPLLADN